MGSLVGPSDEHLKPATHSLLLNKTARGAFYLEERKERGTFHQPTKHLQVIYGWVQSNTFSLVLVWGDEA